jgi:hypothetical protein
VIFFNTYFSRFEFSDFKIRELRAKNRYKLTPMVVGSKYLKYFKYIKFIISIDQTEKERKA